MNDTSYSQYTGLLPERLLRSMILVAIFGFYSAHAQSDDTVLRILRPRPEGEQVSPTWTELYYIVIDARHPRGIEKLQLWKEGAKKAERSFKGSDRHDSGYFLYSRRMKSEGVRDFVIKMWPVGKNPDVDAPIISEQNFPLKYSDPDPELADYIAYTNLSDGEVVEANDPRDPSDLTYVLVDCQDSSGVWGGGHWKEEQHMGYRDDDGIDWVELVITGPDGKENVLRNESALILDSDQKFHGPYWGKAKNPELKKKPEEPWSDGVEWEPIEGFGLYQFTVSLLPGDYQFGLRAQNSEGEVIEGPAIRIKAERK